VTTQTHYKTCYGLKWMTSRHPAIRRLKRRQNSNALHGNKTWNASLILVDYLQQHPLPEQSRVLELGCGWGLSGIYCAKQQHRVTGLDADTEVFAFLERQASLNEVEINTLLQDFSSIRAEQLANIDVLIGSDICFWDQMAEDLFNCLTLALASGVKKIIISDPNRPPFLEVAEACINDHFAELIPWQSQAANRPKGSILLIENA
jgi:predicted nicotinamide N-methyase